MAPPTLDVLYEDNHLLAINKPAGLPTMGVAAEADSLIGLARAYIKQQYHKPGGVYLGIVSRLDAGTSGVVLLARTSKAAARLSAQFRERSLAKTYWAIVSGDLHPAEGSWTDWVLKDEPRQRMAVVESQTPGARQAQLRYRQLGKVTGGTWVEIELLTGRKHQIRLQFAARGCPVWGETKYAQGRAFEGLALHARRLVCEHPVRRQTLELVAPLPPSWRRAGVQA